MSIKKIRYFAGFMGSQAKWLNSMAAKGFRLVKTGILSYEFEECAPDAYCYTVEYVGDRSFEAEKDYKAFLEDMGYRVFYKNINLNWSFGKVTIRPWAEKGGVFSTSRSTYNRELLIVEKKNDGKPFELHTEKEDLADYYRRLSYPWYFMAFLMLAMLILLFPMPVPTAIFGVTAGACILYIIILWRKIAKLKKEKELEE